MGTRVAAALLAATALAVSGCSGDDGDESQDSTPTQDASTATGPTSPAGSPDTTCADSFNADAPDDFPRLIRLSHGVGAAILTGTYAGDEFTAQTYGTSADDPGSDQTVSPGACVVTEQGDSGAALYVFAVAADDEWHWFLESDPTVPLSSDPASQLADVVPVTLDDSGAAPDLVPGPS